MRRGSSPGGAERGRNYLAGLGRGPRGRRTRGGRPERVKRVEGPAEPLAQRAEPVRLGIERVPTGGDLVALRRDLLVFDLDPLLEPEPAVGVLGPADLGARIRGLEEL